ncbi:MAG: capsule assembly Wzi family protein, partial [Abditibacteriales bacterium]|nr:capsule assembly Wzi family protein [Abditibacteriales bacterium]MDW8367218.1 hypothetical protein [Abditibacteriales bacterium]
MHRLLGWTAALLMFLSGGIGAAEKNLVGLVTAVRGNVVELSVGSDEGVHRGMVFVTKVQTAVTARLEVTAVSANRSTARIVQKMGIVTVGDTVELDAAASAPSKPILAPQPPNVLTSQRSTVSPPQRPEVAARAVILAVEQDKLIISAGRADGLEAGTYVTLHRGQQRVATFHVSRVEAHQAEGRVFNVERGVSLAVGDEMTLSFQASDGITGPPVSPANERVPQLPQFTVPRTEKTYDLLGALASEGLITKYPARVFHEDSPFQSRAENSIVFTRAQVAELINEALHNLAQQPNEKVAHGSIAALNQLVRDYEKELRMLRADFESVEMQLEKAQSERAPYGFSGFLRFGNVRASGSGIAPRTEFGQSVDTGFNVRFNLFANISRKMRFEGQFDTNSESTTGRSTNIRRAVLTIDDAIKLPLLGRVQWEAGRGDFWYGVGRFSTLLLSDTGGPYDYVKARYRIGSDFLYEGFATVIGNDPRKNLYGHRLETHVGNRIRLGVAETMLAAHQGLSGTFLLTSFVPTLPFVLVDRMTNNVNTNPVSILYVEANVAEGFHLYSEVLLDDLVIREREPLPHRAGFLLGAQGFLAKNPLKFNGRLEFVHLQPGVYQSLNVVENYFRGGRPIGYLWATPDPRARGINSIHLDLNWMPVNKLTLGFNMELADWGADDPLLSRQNIVRFRALYDVSRNFSIGLRALRTSTTNDNFVPHAFGKQSRWEFYLLRTF